MTLRVTVLGSSGMFATKDRACAGYLLEFAERRIWLDAGGGTWRNLLGHIAHDKLDGVILSHRHPDHTIDLFQAFHARHYGGAEPLPPIPLWAPAETLERVVDFSKEVAESFDVRPVAAGQTLTLFGADVSFVDMAHPAETVGVRVEVDGRVLAYSADTGPAADFVALAGDADLFVCEASFQEADPGWSGHLTAAEAASFGAEARVRKLLLSHLPPNRDVSVTLDQARAASPALAVELARDNMTLEVGSD